MPDLTSQILPEILNNRLEKLPLGDDLVVPYYHGLSLVNLPATITHLLGMPTFGQPPLDESITNRLGGPYEKVVVVLVDALGFNAFKRLINSDPRMVWGQHLDSAVLCPLSSICPSTTASALTSLWTGVGAASHGIIGYEMWAKEFGMVINNILHTPAAAKTDVGGLARSGFVPSEFMDKPLFGQHLNKFGVKPAAFMHKSIANSGLSVMQMQGVHVHPYFNEADLFISLADYVNNRAGSRDFVYIYYSDIDTLMHHYDILDRRVALQFGAFSKLFVDGFLKRITARAGKDTLIILTADHGSITTPVYEKYRLENHPKLNQNLVMAPTCEHRLPILYVKPGKVDEVRDYFESVWPDEFILLDSPIALQAGLFGESPFVNGIQDRLGDLIVVSKGDAYLWWSPQPNMMAARHGGLSADEMLTPFYALPLRNIIR